MNLCLFPEFENCRFRPRTPSLIVNLIALRFYYGIFIRKLNHEEMDRSTLTRLVIGKGEA